MKIIQISDTHFSPTKPHFNDNWDPIRQWIEEEQPDLVVHTGDLTVDGADLDEDLSFSMALLGELTVPVLVLPGNHDVGHMPGSHQPVDDLRLKRWRDFVGPDRFAKTIGDWLVIGVNSLLIGSGHIEEEAQFAWLSESLANRNGRRAVIFAHKPLFVDDPNEGDTGYWGAPPRQRREIIDLLTAHQVALFASGHLHWAWQGRLGVTQLVWAPPTSFIIDKLEREMPGSRLIGAAIHRLGQAVESELVSVAGTTAHVLDEVIDEVYPRNITNAPVEAAQ
ncbi:metallophosphoesterase (plasmid) [Rhizobium sp. WL3]|uniref:metallophosphoesterase family protein n=1 Tax=Rhizobium sp. WL3 TaxID=2603277 RepID=UPI0011C2092B|nr:metallophosphoesterase [Rhizobium sp. WL3]QEE43622.1 metallophosphoesterase [Rhizobium sp. WL3]